MVQILDTLVIRSRIQLSTGSGRGEYYKLLELIVTSKGTRGSGLPAPIHTKVGEEGKDGTKIVKSSWQSIELDERTIGFSDARMMEPASRPFRLLSTNAGKANKIKASRGLGLQLAFLSLLLKTLAH